MVLRFAVAACLLGLTGCGVIYTSPEVEDGWIFGEAPDTDFEVDVVDLTYETAVAANLEPFVPQRLPAAFQPEAVAAARAREEEAIRRAVGGVGSLPSLAGLPAPTAPARSRPGFIPDRLPPRLEPRPYQIGVADVLLLSVNAPTTLEDLPGLIDAQAKRQGYVVQDDGAIAVPDVGRVQVAGLSLQDAEARIFDAVAAAGIDPSFTLEITEFNSQRVAVGGLVGQPTVVPITLKPLYLNEAIQLAGGLATPDPTVATIQVFRDGEEFQLSAERFLNEPGLQRFLLLDGDTVFVATDYLQDQAARRFDELLRLRSEAIQTTNFRIQLETLRNQQLGFERAQLEEDRELFMKRLELGAVPRQYAYVAGEVRNTGRFPLPFENQANLADVLLGDDGVGGLEIRGSDYEEIYVLRGLLDPDQFGGVRAYHLDAENAVNLVAATTFKMRPNDVVFVAEQPVTAWNRTLSQILPQLILTVARDFTGT